MHLRMRATGVNEARLFLQNTAGRTSAALRDEMRRVAEDTAALARDMAPERDGDLQLTIHTVEQPSSKHRFHVSVVAGGVSKLGRDTSGYAAIMHENYEDLVSMPETIERKERKERRTGQIVGSKFLTRALEATDKTLANRLGRVMLLIGGKS